jgi:hypothetical protein
VRDFVTGYDRDVGRYPKLLKPAWPRLGFGGAVPMIRWPVCLWRLLQQPQQWTEAKVDHLKTLARRKVSAKYIAKALGRHVGSVKSKARELGLMLLKEAKDK